MTKTGAIIILCVACCWTSLSARANDFYVDPIHGSLTGDGSSAHPWKSIQALFHDGLVESRQWKQLPYAEGTTLTPRNGGAPITSGDTLWLRSGQYGSLEIQGYYNTDTITLAAEEGHAPQFTSILIRSSSHWTLHGLTISMEFAEDYQKRTLVQLRDHGFHGPIHDISVIGCSIHSVSDTSPWTVEDWNALACSGLQVDGTRMTICGNRLRNVDFGISVSATHSLIQGNWIENFSGDGLRGLGDYCTFQYNTVKNCYNVNDNHDDGFQSWSVGPTGVGSGEVRGMVLRGNTIINYEDPNQPHRGPLQGIGCFDGTFVNWVVENNVIIVDHWHGITLMGAHNCRILNNTVMDRNDIRPGPPWIRIDNHKNGTPPQDCLVRNNLTTSLGNTAGYRHDHNLIVTDPGRYFSDPNLLDLQLKETAPAIDAGSPELAPALDRRGIPRPQGTAIDVGAFEWFAGDVNAVDITCDFNDVNGLPENL